ncbi:MAG TPA: queuosine precursor transporter [Propionibacteriaceae bacterium]
MTALDSPDRTVHYARGGRGNYDLVVAAFCGLLLISNVGATKAIAFPLPFNVPVLGDRLITDGGAFLFPLTYVLGDVLAEVYGLRRARRAIVMGFALAALASVTFLVVGATPPAPGWPNQDAWSAVLGFVPRIVVASLCGYLAGQFLNAYVLVKIKARTRERSLWARLVGSTVIGELADTALFCTIAFAGILSTRDLIGYTVVGYVYKVLVEVVCLPVTYAVIRAIKRREPEYVTARGATSDDANGTESGSD